MTQNNMKFENRMPTRMLFDPTQWRSVKDMKYYLKECKRQNIIPDHINEIALKLCEKFQELEYKVECLESLIKKDEANPLSS